MAVETVCYYALGGGLGHLTRALAVITALQRLAPHRFHYTLITNCAHAPKLATGVDRLITISSPAELRAALASALQPGPDIFIVDTFPRGLMGELADQIDTISCPRVLMQRYLSPQYVEQYRIAEFVSDHYELALRLADNLPVQRLSARTIDLPPVTIGHYHGEVSVPSLFKKERARILFVDFGPAADPYIDLLGDDLDLRIVTMAEARLAGDGRAFNYYPAARLLAAADLVIGSCGYNLYHEVRQAGVAAIFLPQAKTYDDQFGRARGSLCATTVGQFQELLTRWQSAPRQREIVADGAAVAANILIHHRDTENAEIK